MTEEPKKDPQGGGEGAGEGATNHDEAIQKLTEQVGNLTKGIATYRDESQQTKEALKVATEELEALKKRKADADDDTDLSDEDQKKFDAWAAKQGFLTKDEMESEKSKIASESAKNVASIAVNDFLEKHPEYDDDDKWAKIREQFELYKTPVDLAGYKKLLNRIHKDLSGEKDSKAVSKAKAEIINNSRLSLGNGRGGASAGDEEATVDAYQKRYPNLSREQIEARLGEIKNLYPDKK